MLRNIRASSSFVCTLCFFHSLSPASMQPHQSDWHANQNYIIVCIVVVAVFCSIQWKICSTSIKWALGFCPLPHPKNQTKHSQANKCDVGTSLVRCTTALLCKTLHVEAVLICTSWLLSVLYVSPSNIQPVIRFISISLHKSYKKKLITFLKTSKAAVIAATTNANKIVAYNDRHTNSMFPYCSHARFSISFTLASWKSHSIFGVHTE